MSGTIVRNMIGTEKRVLRQLTDAEKKFFKKTPNWWNWIRFHGENQLEIEEYRHSILDYHFLNLEKNEKKSSSRMNVFLPNSRLFHWTKSVEQRS